MMRFYESERKMKATCRNRTGDLRFTKPQRRQATNRKESVTHDNAGVMESQKSEKSLTDTKQAQVRVSRVSSIPEPFVEWAVVEDYPGYEVSSEGQVRNRATGKVRRLRTDSSGYLSVSLPGEKHPVPYRVHVLVAEAFIGPRPDDLVLDHLDGDKSNNTPTNLEYVARGENTRRAYAMGLCDGTAARGERQGHAKLTEAEVREIVNLLPGHSNKDIGDQFGVNQATIWQIRKGNSWTHVTGF